MTEKSVYNLIIDKEFQDLIRPLQPSELETLERNLLADGCLNPLITWNGVIIDGHNRYKLCHKNNIPFAYQEMNFKYREEAIAWICSNQLGRRNITEATRKFLIGKQYESEKLAKKKTLGQRMKTISEEEGARASLPPSERSEFFKKRTSERIARDNNISHGTVEKYAIYAKAMDDIAAVAPDFAKMILCGNYKISHEKLVELSQMSPGKIKMVERKMARMNKPFLEYNRTRAEIQKTQDQVNEDLHTPSIKDMPQFDPDGEITSLTLTIPSWTSSIERVRTKSDLGIISGKARLKLLDALGELQNSINSIISDVGVN